MTGIKESLKLDELERHIILYSKYHYKITDPIEDLEVIIGKYIYGSPEYVDIRNIWHFVSDIFIKYTNQNTKDWFFRELFNFNSILTPKEYNCEEMVKAILFKVFSMYDITHDTELMNQLGEPDYTLLPKAGTIYIAEDGMQYNKDDIYYCIDLYLQDTSYFKKEKQGIDKYEEEVIRFRDFNITKELRIVLYNYVMNALDWQHPYTVLDEIDGVEAQVILNMLYQEGDYEDYRLEEDDMDLTITSKLKSKLKELENKFNELYYK